MPVFGVFVYLSIWKTDVLIDFLCSIQKSQGSGLTLDFGLNKDGIKSQLAQGKQSGRQGES